MGSLTHHFLTMAYNNAWSNHRLLKACCSLNPEEFGAIRTSFFPSIKATLNHILTVDWFYVDALESHTQGKDPNPNPSTFFDPPEPYQTCADLQQAQRINDLRLIQACGSITDASLAQIVVIPREIRVQREPMSRLLAHLFQHQIHHRGQVHAMLSGTSVQPPQLDEFFCVEEAVLREDDLREMGLSEKQIWDPQD